MCNTISTILAEGVAGDGGARNAYVPGYRIAAKTGTSEKVGDNRDAYICSCITYAPAENPRVTALIMVDEPTSGVLYGSTVAAPYVGDALESILPYMGIQANYTEEELDNMAVRVSGYKGWSVSYAQRVIEQSGMKVRVVGNGTVVTSQLPESGTYVEKKGATVVLYTGKEAPSEDVSVPDLTGMTAALANQTLINLGLNVKIEGTPHYLSGNEEIVVVEQSHPKGTMVAKGTVVTLTFRYIGGDDA